MTFPATASPLYSASCSAVSSTTMSNLDPIDKMFSDITASTESALSGDGINLVFIADKDPSQSPPLHTRVATPPSSPVVVAIQAISSGTLSASVAPPLLTLPASQSAHMDDGKQAEWLSVYGTQSAQTASNASSAKAGT